MMGTMRSNMNEFVDADELLCCFFGCFFFFFERENLTIYGV